MLFIAGGVVFILFVIGLFAKWYFHLRLLPTFTSELPPGPNTSYVSRSPIIHEGMDVQLGDAARKIGISNINGPTLITVPSWVQQPLGKYYLYFAHHIGQYIRMAYADDLKGPWTLHQDQILPLQESLFISEKQPVSSWNTLRKYTSWSEATAIAQVGREALKAYHSTDKNNAKKVPATMPHIASPELFIDEASQQIRMYYHGIVEGNIQMTKVALSKDGLTFKPRPEILGLPYMRVFTHKGIFYALSMPGILYKSHDGLSDFKPRTRWIFNTDVRHTSLLKEGDMLHLFYSRVGDAPERILYCRMDIGTPNWNLWKTSKPVEIARPELSWEGVSEAITPSVRGEVGQLVHQLRDPFVFRERDDWYLFYSGGGEQNIGLRKLSWPG